jgi:hypothetical protein
VIAGGAVTAATAVAPKFFTTPKLAEADDSQATLEETSLVKATLAADEATEYAEPLIGLTKFTSALITFVIAAVPLKSASGTSNCKAPIA